MIRLMYEYYETETRMKACVSLNSSVPVGTMAAYGLTALDMAVGLEGHVRSGRLSAAGSLSILAPGHEPGGTVRGGIRGSRDLGQAGQGGREETFCGGFRKYIRQLEEPSDPVGLSFF